MPRVQHAFGMVQGRACRTGGHLRATPPLTMLSQRASQRAVRTDMALYRNRDGHAKAWT